MTHTIAEAEVARLHSLLIDHHVRDGQCEFSRVWSAIEQWVRTGTGDAVSNDVQLGFECSRNPHSSSQRDPFPVPAEGLPSGPLFNVMFFWDFSPGGEAGVELWYSADADWETLTAEPDWDGDHQIGFHLRGYAGARAVDYIRAVESTSYARMAAQKRPSIVRVFRTSGPDVIVRCCR